MILTCPQCRMRYMVADGAIGPLGRRVRCSNCRHMWFEEGVPGHPGKTQWREGVDDPDGMPPLIHNHFVGGASPDDEEAEKDFQSMLRRTMEEETQEGGETDPLSESRRKNILEKQESQRSAEALRDRASIRKRNVVSGAILFALLLGLVFGGLAGFRKPIVKAYPKAILLYEMMGIPLPPPGDGLALESLEAFPRKGKDGQDVLFVRGRILNLKAHAVEAVPPVLVTVVDEAGAPLLQKVFLAKDAMLAAEGHTTFEDTFPMPESAKNVRFSFSYLQPQVEQTDEGKQAEPPVHGDTAAH